MVRVLQAARLAASKACDEEEASLSLWLSFHQLGFIANEGAFGSYGLGLTSVEWLLRVAMEMLSVASPH